MTDKVRENRVRRAAERQEVRLRKSRRRDQRAVGYGRWSIGNDPKYTHTIDEIEQILGVNR